MVKDGLIDPGLSSPFLRSAHSTLRSVDLDTTTSGEVERLPNAKFRISGVVSAEVVDPDGAGDIRQVVFRILEPNSSDFIASGVLEHVDSTYSASYTFVIDRAGVGTYRIEVTAQDLSDLVSNAVQIPLLITRTNSRPVASHLIAPDTLHRPVSGSLPVLFSLAVSDSDGYGDIDQVFFKRLSPLPQNMFDLFDDGNRQIHGDTVAGDGTFSLLVQITSSAILGDQVFVFLAKDKTGAFSDSLYQTISIVP